MTPSIAVLIERLEKATGPNRELDWAIDCIFKPWHSGCKYEVWSEDDHDDTGIRWFDESKQKWYPDHLPSYTDSVDAAISVIPAGCDWLMASGRTRPEEPLYAMQICEKSDGAIAQPPPIGEAESEIIAIAIVLAALRSRAALEDKT